MQIYAEVLSVDPVRDVMQLRLDFATGSDHLGVRFAVPADRDMLIEAGDGDSQQDISFRRGERMDTLTISADLQTGEIDHYPFDHYQCGLMIAAFERSGETRGPPIPLRLTVWKQIAGWEIAAHPAQIPRAGLALSFDIERKHLQVIIATVLYCAMTLMALVALTITSLSFLGIRRVDTTLAAVQATMVFTLPALRNMMPGAPPIGVHGDNLVLFWAEVIVVISLAVNIAIWSRHGDGR